MFSLRILQMLVARTPTRTSSRPVSLAKSNLTATTSISHTRQTSKLASKPVQSSRTKIPTIQHIEQIEKAKYHAKISWEPGTATMDGHDAPTIAKPANVNLDGMVSFVLQCTHPFCRIGQAACFRSQQSGEQQRRIFAHTSR